MAMTVTATMSGTAANQHIYLWIRVYTQAAEAGGASAAGLNASGGTGVTASLTPNFTGSLPLFAVTADNWGGTYTAAASNTIDSSSADADTWGAGFGRYTGTVTAATPLTFGASGVGGSCDYSTWACYELPGSGGSPVLDGSSPALASATGAGIKTVTSASFTPPAGSVVVAMVCGGGTGSSGSFAVAITNTGGLSFTQRAGTATVADQDTFVFTATAGGAAAAPAASPARPGRTWMRRFRHRQQLPPPPPVIPPVTATAAGAGAVTATVTQIATGAAAGAGSVTASAGKACIAGLGGTGAGYFADQYATPRFVLGDAAWGLCGNAGRWNSGAWQTDYDTFFTNRAAQGFTAIYLKPMGTTQNLGINDDGRTFDPLFPFQGGTPSTGVSNANPSSGLTASYWARIDYMFASAQARGITIFLNAIGYNSDFNGGPGPLAGKSTTEFTAYGTALGTRYKNQVNLVWNLSDDYFGGTTPDSLITAFMTGVRGAGDTHAVAIENMPESDSRKGFARTDTGCGTTNLSTTVTDTSIAASDAGARVTGSGIPANTVINSVTPGTSFVMNNQATATASVSLTLLDYGLPWGTTNAQFNFVYSYNVTYYGIERAYLEASPITVLAGDGYFYQGNNVYQGGTGAFGYDRAIRQDAWHAISSGARGIIHGSESIWQYQSTALAASSTDWYYVNNAGNIRTLMESLPGWQLLVPDTSSLLVTGGRGTHASAFLSGGGGGQYEVSTSDSYVTASRGPDSGSGASLAVIYMSHATTITIDQTKMASGYTATWVDPVTCATSSATVGSTYNSTAKGNNSRGEADWVLVLQGPSGSTGTASAAGAGSVTAVATVIAPATAAGAGSVADTATEAAPATAAAAAAATGKVTQAAGATAAGAGAATAVATEIAAAAGAGAGSVTALAAQIAGAATAGAGAVSDVATQIAGATAAGAGSVTAVGSVSGVSSGTASIAGAAAVTALATQIVPAAATAAGQATAAATQAAGATAAGAGSAAAAATQVTTGTAAGAGSAAPAPATQIVTASAAGAGSVTAAGSVTGAGATATAAAAATAGPAPATQIVPAAAAGVTTAAAGATQTAGSGAAGSASASALATQIAGAAAAAAGSVTAVGAVSGQSTGAAAGTATATGKATQAATGTAAAAATATAAATIPAAAAAAGAGSVTAAGYITGTANVAGAGTSTAKGTQAAFATASGAGAASALATQRATAAAAGAGQVTATSRIQLAFTVGTLTTATAPLATLTGGATAGTATLTATDTRTGGPT